MKNMNPLSFGEYEKGISMFSASPTSKKKIVCKCFKKNFFFENFGEKKKFFVREREKTGVRKVSGNVAGLILWRGCVVLKILSGILYHDFLRKNKNLEGRNKKVFFYFLLFVWSFVDMCPGNNGHFLVWEEGKAWKNERGKKKRIRPLIFLALGIRQVVSSFLNLLNLFLYLQSWRFLRNLPRKKTKDALDRKKICFIWFVISVTFQRHNSELRSWHS